MALTEMRLQYLLNESFRIYNVAVLQVELLRQNAFEVCGDFNFYTTFDLQKFLCGQQQFAANPQGPLFFSHTDRGNASHFSSHVKHIKPVKGCKSNNDAIDFSD